MRDSLALATLARFFKDESVIFLWESAKTNSRYLFLFRRL